MGSISRYTERLAAVTIGTSIGTTTEINCESFTAGMIFVPAGSSITTLTFFVAPVKAGNYHALYDHNTVAVVLTVAAGRAYPFPVATFGARALKLVGNVAGTVDITQIG